jgi:hypothetical protein
VERAVRRPDTAAAAARAREIAHAHLLALYVATGLFFMLLPGTFLGVWNLFEASQRHSVGLVPTAWLQAHGHAQVFGWVGTFILGIGLYAVPLVRSGARPSLAVGRTCWALWTAGVAARWTAAVYGWHWRPLFIGAALFETAAFVIFAAAVVPARTRAPGSRPDPWVRIVLAGAAGFALTVASNLVLSVFVAWHGDAPVVPHGLNQRFLTLATWGFLAPFIWGFSARWLPVLLGLAPARIGALSAAVALNGLGVLLTLAGMGAVATALFFVAAGLAAVSLRVFEPAHHPAKIRGVHPSFPAFVRLAYAWLVIAAGLGMAAAAWDVSGGLWGASRHAFTVGFVSVMVFAIGQRMLPAFAAMAPLWSPALMVVSLTALTTGCLLRVGAEMVAYQHGAAWAWSVLPASAVLELAAVTAFAVNLIATFALAPEPLVVSAAAAAGATASESVRA